MEDVVNLSEKNLGVGQKKRWGLVRGVIFIVIIIIICIFFLSAVLFRTEPNEYERAYQHLGPQTKSPEVCAKIGKRVKSEPAWGAERHNLRSYCYHKTAYNMFDLDLCEFADEDGRVSQAQCRADVGRIRYEILSQGLTNEDFTGPFTNFDYPLILSAMGYTEDDCRPYWESGKYGNPYEEYQLEAKAIVEGGCGGDQECVKYQLKQAQESLYQTCYLELEKTDEFKSRLKNLPDFSNE